jgi:recombination protein RecA
MFSMSVAIDLLRAATLKRGGLALVPSHQLEPSAGAPHPASHQEADPLGVSLGWPALEAALPDGALPRGVVELSTVGGLGGATQVALAAVRGGQARGAGAWCAWVDPEGSLYAPGVAKAAVDLARLLVVRPPRKDLPHVVVKLAQSRAFEVIVVDYAPPALVRERAPSSLAGARPPRRRRGALRPEILVRKLALLAEEGGRTVVLLTDSTEPRPAPWPVALRLALARVPGAMTVEVAKERFCRLGSTKVAWPPPAPGAEAAGALTTG